MKLHTLVTALALAGGLALPGQVEAKPRHGRQGVVVVDRGHHRHARWRAPYGYYRPHRSYRYAPYYAPYYGGAYAHGPYYGGHLHFHGRASCYLPHLSIHLGW